MLFAEWPSGYLINLGAWFKNIQVLFWIRWRIVMWETNGLFTKFFSDFSFIQNESTWTQTGLKTQYSHAKTEKYNLLVTSVQSSEQQFPTHGPWTTPPLVWQPTVFWQYWSTCACLSTCVLTCLTAPWQQSVIINSRHSTVQITPSHPLQEDRGITDDLCGRISCDVYRR